LALTRVLGLVEGLGVISVEKLVEWVTRRPDNIRQLHQAPLPTNRAKGALIRLSETIDLLLGPDMTDADKAARAHNWYSLQVPDLYPDDHPARQADVAEVRDMAMTSGSLATFLSELTLDPPNNLVVGEGKSESGGGSEGAVKRDVLTLSTIHSAKGLEWPHVFLISAVDGRFPSPYVRGQEALGEELRLMYVAVTRAQDTLTITIPLEAAPVSVDNPAPSRFLAGLTAQSVQVYRRGRLSDDEAPLGLLEDPDDQASYMALPGRRPPRTTPSRPVDRGPGHRPEAGQRVRHPFYGPGRVLKVTDQNARVDFDSAGPKNVMIAFAKLTLLDG
jgi:DNA helicase-2/ATP-dependent DNA helicase PcrA